MLEQQGAEISTDERTGHVRFITMPIESPIATTTALVDPTTAEAVARAFLRRFGPAFGNTAIAANLVTMSNQSIAESGRYVRFQQTYQQVPILAGELSVHVLPTMQVASVHGKVLPDYHVDTTPTVSAATAETQALSVIEKAYGQQPDHLSAKNLGLWIYHPDMLGSPHAPITSLNWRFEVRNDYDIRALVLVDAHHGTITLQFNQIAHALDQRVCNANNVVDSDSNQNNNCATDSQATRLNGLTSSGVVDVDTAWENAKATYEFFNTVLGRDSIDDAGMKIISLVNYCPLGDSCPYANAFWDGVQMTYGSTYASADDVVAHELTHGVTEKTAGLYYYFQSGAINESLSDVFGEFVDQWYVGPSGDLVSDAWLMGEDLPIGAIRSMSNPGLFGDPDKMTSTNYNNGLYLGEISDNGGVHSNSGVNNKAASLLVDGGSFNGYTISALGLTKTAQLYYRVVTAYLLSGSDYQDLGGSLNAACSAFVTTGSFGFVTSDCVAVQQTVLATEMAKSPPRAPATEASTCSANETKIDLYADSFESVAPSKWAKTPSTGSDWYYPAPTWAQYATLGLHSIGHLYPTNQSDQRFTMLTGFYVPVGATLRFDHSYDFEAYYNASGSAITSAYDGGIVEYSLDSGSTWVDAKPLFVTNGYNSTLIVSKNTNVLAGRTAFSGLSNGYISSKLILSSLAGKHIRFRFRVTTDRYVTNRGWYIDNVNAYRCITSAQSAETLSTGANTSCFTSYTNGAWCWGANTQGQAGTTTTATQSIATTVKTLSGSPITGITDIAAGSQHSCAVTSSGSVSCWGANTSGQLGDGTKTRRLGAVSVINADASTLSTQIAVAVGQAHSCALSAAGTVSCWGANAYGELGDGTRTASVYPVPVKKANGDPLSGVKMLSVGSTHSCAVVADRTVWCWGNRASGATGSPLASNAGAVQVRTATGILSGVSQVTSGKQYSCALTGTAGTWCWGLNTHGQIGDGTRTNRALAVSVKAGSTPLKNLVSIAAGAGGHTCAVSSASVGYCWGDNASSQLGDGSVIERTTAVTFAPAVVASIGPIKEVSVGEAHTCARTNGGAVWCWGRNTSGQLGIGRFSSKESPTRSKNTRGLIGE
jgi:Zn-dependent metalloprotease/alpha-tubulin suppressor-like RCC1 family protein